MLRRILIRILVALRLREPKEKQPPLESLVDLMPLAFARLVIAGVINWLGLEVSLPWYKRWFRRFKFYARYARLKIIGW